MTDITDKKVAILVDNFFEDAEFSKPLQALKNEGIAVEVIAAEPLQQLQHSYPDKIILLDVWNVTQFHGEPHGKEGQKIRWVPIAQLLDIEIPDAIIPIVEALQKQAIKS